MDNIGIIKITYAFEKYLGGRFQSAGLSLSLQASEQFTFTSKIHWPDKNFESAIIQGIKEGCMDIHYDSNKLAVSLLSVDIHPVDSSEKSFYQAARIAIRTREDLEELKSTTLSK